MEGSSDSEDEVVAHKRQWNKADPLASPQVVSMVTLSHKDPQ